MGTEWFIKERKEGGVVMCFSGPGEDGKRNWANIYLTTNEWLDFSQEIEMWGDK